MNQRTGQQARPFSVHRVIKPVGGAKIDLTF